MLAIESAIVDFYARNPDTTDQQVLKALATNIRAGQPSQGTEDLCSDIRSVADIAPSDTIWIDALRSIYTSVKTHEHKYDPQSYLDFVQIFVSRAA